ISRTPFLYSLIRSSRSLTAALCRSLSFCCSSESPAAGSTGLRKARIFGLISGEPAGFCPRRVPIALPERTRVAIANVEMTDENRIVLVPPLHEFHESAEYLLSASLQLTRFLGRLYRDRTGRRIWLHRDRTGRRTGGRIWLARTAGHAGSTRRISAGILTHVG